MRGSNRQTEKETNTSHLQQHGEITLPPSGQEGQSAAEEERKRVRERVGASRRTSAMSQQMEMAMCRRRGKGKRWGFAEEQSRANCRQVFDHFIWRRCLLSVLCFSQASRNGCCWLKSKVFYIFHTRLVQCSQYTCSSSFLSIILQ